jgi:hypothetical protein
MPIRRLLEGSGLAPDEVENLCRAYEKALRELRVVDRNDPLTKLLGQRVIEVGKSGGDPAEIARLAVKSLRIDTTGT